MQRRPRDSGSPENARRHRLATALPRGCDPSGAAPRLLSSRYRPAVASSRSVLLGSTTTHSTYQQQQQQQQQLTDHLAPSPGCPCARVDLSSLLQITNHDRRSIELTCVDSLLIFRRPRIRRSPPSDDRELKRALLALPL